MIEGAHRYPRQDIVIYGRPAAEALCDIAEQRGARRLFLVSTASLKDSSAADLERDLKGLCVGAYAGVTAHSPREGVLAGAAAAREARADLLVALGGSSVVDATKVMQLCLWAGLSTVEALDPYRVRPGPPAIDLTAIRPAVRMIAVPTTLSAAEFTPFAGVRDTARNAKERFGHADLAPIAVILDPSMTLATPERLWLSTGMKAIDHAVEQYCHRVRAPFGDALAIDALGRLARSLPATLRDPEDLAARQECQFGMWLSISGGGRGGGPSHALGHTLGGSYGVPHGITSCLTLWAVLKWNEGVDARRQAAVAQAMNRPGVSASQAVRDLVENLGLPTRLSDVGIGQDQFEPIARHTLGDTGIAAGPRPIDRWEDIAEILAICA